jgi:hypothetical protein
VEDDPPAPTMMAAPSRFSQRTNTGAVIDVFNNHLPSRQGGGGKPDKVTVVVEDKTEAPFKYMWQKQEAVVNSTFLFFGMPSLVSPFLVLYRCFALPPLSFFPSPSSMSLRPFVPPSLPSSLASVLDKRIELLGDALSQRFYLEPQDSWGLSSQAVIVHTGMVCTDGESPLKSTVMLQR